MKEKKEETGSLFFNFPVTWHSGEKSSFGIEAIYPAAAKDVIERFQPSLEFLCAEALKEVSECRTSKFTLDQKYEQPKDLFQVDVECFKLTITGSNLASQPDLEQEFKFEYAWLILNSQLESAFNTFIRVGGSIAANYIVQYGGVFPVPIEFNKSATREGSE